MTILYNLALRIQTGRATRVLKPNRNMLSKVQKDNHNLRKMSQPTKRRS